jgi:hypothetical protein
VSALAIIITIIGVVVVLLVVGGLIAINRRWNREDRKLRVAIQEADTALALARAADNGWHRETLEAAARDAFAVRSPAEVRELQLVKVVDKPGTEEDQALFRVITDAGSEDILLARQGGTWHAAEPL